MCLLSSSCGLSPVFFFKTVNVTPCLEHSSHSSELLHRFIHHLKAKLSFPLMLWFVRTGQYLAEIKLGYLKIRNLRVQKKILIIEKFAFKVVQMKCLAIHITNQKLRFDVFTVGNLLNIFMIFRLLNILKIFGIKEKSIILTYTMYCWLLL